MTYFISVLQNGMAIREEVLNENDLDEVIDHHKNNKIYKSCIMYTLIDNVPVAINVHSMDDRVVEYYQKINDSEVDVWFNNWFTD